MKAKFIGSCSFSSHNYISVTKNKIYEIIPINDYYHITDDLGIAYSLSTNIINSMFDLNFREEKLKRILKYEKLY